jgi:hypothetical protein
MGIIKRIITYAAIGALGIGIGNYAARCSIESKYELIPKNTIEKKVQQNNEQSIEYIKSNKATIDDKLEIYNKSLEESNEYNRVIDKYGK